MPRRPAGGSPRPVPRTEPSSAHCPGPDRHQIQRSFDPKPPSVRQARGFVTSAIGCHADTAQCDNIRSCVSELAGNAILRTGASGSPFAVRVFIDQHGCVRLEVHDQDRATAPVLANHPVRLTLRKRNTGESTRVTADLVVLATGYRDLGPTEHDEPYPEILAPVVNELTLKDTGVLHMKRDYIVPPRAGAGAWPPLFLNGLCENTHGLGDAGSFSLLQLRARTLLEGIRHRLGADREVAESARHH